MLPSSHAMTGESPSPPAAGASGEAPARVALLGNPSDGFQGKTLGLAIVGMTATVTLGPADRGAADRLIGAAIKRFNRSAGTAVSAAASLRTTIPREVGLGGSSAIVLATLRALCVDCDRQLDPDELAAMALAVEVEDLGIAAGPQDRFVQAHGGLLYMDFAGGTRCERLDPGLLPPLFCAYHEGAAASSAGVHRDLRRRFDAGEDGVSSLLGRIADLAEHGREALLGGRAAELGELMARNFELRSQLVELEPAHVRMIDLARELGAGANYAGSGGAIVGVVPQGGIDRLREAFAAEGCALVAAIPARFSAGRPL
jgi:glucuronokinase